MFKNTMMKKLSVVAMSLALIMPVSMTSISANHVHMHKHYHVVRVYKHVHKAHFKSAKFYRKSWKRAEAHHVSYHKWLRNVLGVQKHNYAYQKGFNNSLHAHADMKLVHNKSYRNGFVLALIANNNNFHFTKKAFKLAQSQYKGTALNGSVNK